MATSLQGSFSERPRASVTAGLKFAPETPPSAYIDTMSTQAMEVTAQMGLPVRTFRPIVSTRRKVPMNSARYDAMDPSPMAMLLDYWGLLTTILFVIKSGAPALKHADLSP